LVGLVTIEHHSDVLVVEARVLGSAEIIVRYAQPTLPAFVVVRNALEDVSGLI
jgi:hypothetical protein